MLHWCAGRTLPIHSKIFCHVCIAGTKFYCEKKIRVPAFYPNAADAKFDFEYYRQHHFPMPLKLLQPYGVSRFEIDKGMFSPGSENPAFIAIGHFFAEDLEKLNKGLALHRAENMEDIKNYTNLSARVQYSEVA